MLKKRLGIEAIERDKSLLDGVNVGTYFKVPSTLIIPEGVKEIGDFAFEFCTNLKEVKIPESVEEIKKYAFCGCKELKEVIISKNVEEIGSRAFGGCNNATIILRKLESEFKEIGNQAFYGVRDVKEEVGA